MVKNNKKKDRKKHSALNPSLRKKTPLSSRYAEVSLFKSLTPSVLPWKRVHR